MDELLDADEIELQRAHPVDMAAAGPDELDENRYEIDQDRYRRKGMDAERARVAVDRDNLEASIRQGLLRDDAREVVDAMTDAQVTALCRDGNPPAFEPVKGVKGGTRGSPKYEDEKWNRGRRGGTVHVARDADAAHILAVTGADKAKDAEWKPQTELERATDALMREIGAKHTDKPLGIEGMNPNFSKGGEWRVNCQRCVPTYEARCRGYDVEALPSSGNMRDPIWQGCRTYEDFSFPLFKNANPIHYKGRKDIEKQMAIWGDGARAQICCGWRGGGAHTFMAVQENGKTRFLDPQSGNPSYNPFPRIGYRSDVQKNYAVFARIDNLEFYDQFKKPSLAFKPV